MAEPQQTARIVFEKAVAHKRQRQEELDAAKVTKLQAERAVKVAREQKDAASKVRDATKKAACFMLGELLQSYARSNR